MTDKKFTTKIHINVADENGVIGSKELSFHGTEDATKQWLFYIWIYSLRKDIKDVMQHPEADSLQNEIKKYYVAEEEET